MSRYIRICSLLLALCLLVSAFFALPVGAATERTEPEQYTSNYDQHEYMYGRWAQPISSYLIAEEDGTFTRVEDTPNGVVVETYNSNYQFVRGIIVPREGYYFGGFHNGESYNFLVFGFSNPAEDDNQEVIRVVRYSKDWERIDCAVLCGANTTVPFDAGSLRFAEYGGYLYIRTAHEMYMSDDGLNHQSNLTLNIRISDMTITDSLYDVKNNNWGYISHSFNQFIAVDGTDLVAVDHGDAYPRSVVLTRYYAPAGQDKFLEPTRIDLGGGYYTYHYAQTLDVLPIGGSIGANDTGVALGGFEISNTHYLVAGNTVSQGATYNPNGQRNIFIAAVDKSNFTPGGVSIQYLTEHTSGVTVSNPHFVKVGPNRYCVLWEETVSYETTLKYAFVDGNGKLEESVYLGSGQLSGCQPVVAGNQLVWYTTSVSAPAFYSISLESPGDASHTCSIRYEYIYPPTDRAKGALEGKCTICGTSAGYVPIPSLQETDGYHITYDPAPTCTESGVAYYTWKDATLYGVVAESYRVPVSANGHDFVDGLCTVCGAGDPNIVTTSGKCGDDVYWSYDGAGTLTISGTGPMWNYTINSSAPWYSYIGEITKVVIGDGVTTIGNCAFYHCGNMESMHIPNTIVRIGDFAFSGCNSLTSVTLPDSLQEIGTMVFFDCTSLTSMTIPASVTKMDNDVFSSCENLKEVHFLCPPPGCYDIFDYPVTIYFDYRNAEWGNGWIENEWEDELTLIPYDPVTGEIFVAAWRLTATMIAYLDQDGVLTVSGTGSMPDWEYSDFLPWYRYTDQIHAVVVDEGVTRIGNVAFCGLYMLDSVQLGSTLKEIGQQSFQGSGMVSITLPEGLESIGIGAFYQCEKLTSVSIPDTVSQIRGYAFAETPIRSVKLPENLTILANNTFDSCTALTSVVIPEGVTYIGGSAFYCCYSLQSVTIPGSVKGIDEFAFSYCISLPSVTLPEGVEALGYAAFHNCTYLTEITLPQTLTLIDEYAFDTTSLRSVDLPQNLSEIGMCVFAECSRLISVTIPNSVQSIGDYAFYNCTSLQSINIPNSVESIGMSAFYNCQSLEQISMSNSVKQIGRNVFEGCSSLKSVTLSEQLTEIPYGAFCYCSELGTISIPEGVTVIREGAFYACEKLTEVNLPESLTSIETFAFGECYELTKLEIPSGVTSIGEGAFAYTCALPYAVIPQGVTSLEKNVFYCSGIQYIVIPNSVATLADAAFDACTELKQVIFCGTQEHFASITCC